MAKKSKENVKATNKATTSEEKKLDFWGIMLGFAKGEGKHLIWAMIASVITGIVVAIQPLVIRYIVDDAIGMIGQKPNDE